MIDWIKILLYNYQAWRLSRRIKAHNARCVSIPKEIERIKSNMQRLQKKISDERNT